MNFSEFKKRKLQQFGDRLDLSDINEDFIPYFESQQRIEVDFGYEIKRGTIGITTGLKPIFILMLTKRSIGSCHTIGKNCKIIKVIK